MSASRQTQHLHLSQYAEVDRPSYIDDYTSDMQRIDSGFNLAQSNALQALSKVTSLSHRVDGMEVLDPTVCIQMSFGSSKFPSQAGSIVQVHQREQHDQVSVNEDEGITVLKEGTYLASLSTSVLPEGLVGIYIYTANHYNRPGRAMYVPHVTAKADLAGVTIDSAYGTGLLSLSADDTIYVEKAANPEATTQTEGDNDIQYTGILTLQRISDFRFNIA